MQAHGLQAASFVEGGYQPVGDEVRVLRGMCEGAGGAQCGGAAGIVGHLACDVWPEDGWVGCSAATDNLVSVFDFFHG